MLFPPILNVPKFYDFHVRPGRQDKNRTDFRPVRAKRLGLFRAHDVKRRRQRVRLGGVRGQSRRGKDVRRGKTRPRIKYVAKTFSVRPEKLRRRAGGSKRAVPERDFHQPFIFPERMMKADEPVLPAAT